MRILAAILLAGMVGCQQPEPTPDIVPDVAVGPFNDRILTEMLAIHNENRNEPLEINDQLNIAAQKHAIWMAKNTRMSHTGEGRSKPGSRIKAAGYDWTSYGENVAYGQDTPAEVMRVWLNSPGHRRNIKSAAYHDIGIGRMTAANGRIYWCVTFGARGFRSDDGWDESWAMPEFENEEL